eukprot:CAMPEP_0183455380 /NCGR_PEP_ID=MMETSP0370-20130417/126501_1 /TAXON_ID=268820 /ORGANISM="Peridinium aciculiferum, Strain PAER-2" /LENGTH=61 /DNA_ID=CAMNT_0025646965 /DNA_START=230 /DNA_END=415 /DNA_ORIENTATION=+
MTPCDLLESPPPQVAEQAAHSLHKVQVQSTLCGVPALHGCVLQVPISSSTSGEHGLPPRDA